MRRVKVGTTREEKLSYYSVAEGDCIVWTGAKVGNGYGKLMHNGKNYRAHRVAYEIHKGLIPEGMQVCHSCDNPACVNPDHLWLGTAKDNEKDKDEKGRRPIGFCHPATKLKLGDVLDIKRRLKDGENHREIAQIYDVTRYAITAINNGRSFANIGV